MPLSSSLILGRGQRLFFGDEFIARNFVRKNVKSGFLKVLVTSKNRFSYVVLPICSDFFR